MGTVVDGAVVADEGSDGGLTVIVTPGDGAANAGEGDVALAVATTRATATAAIPATAEGKATRPRSVAPDRIGSSTR